MSAIFSAPIISPRVDIAFVVLSFVTGLLDSTIYNAFSVFASMQTGNTIFLALGASDLPTGRPFGWLKSLLSIISFTLGASTLSRWSLMYPERYNATSRGTLCISFLLQAALVALVAGLMEGSVLPEKAEKQGDFEPKQIAVVLLLAFPAGCQMATSRLLGIKEMPTTVLTSVFADLFMDPKLIQNSLKVDMARNRRIGTIVFLLLGGICGGWIGKSRAGTPGSLWLIAGIKVLVAFHWLFYKGAALGPVKPKAVQPKVEDLSRAEQAIEDKKLGV